jgi:hypothetical protein
MHQAIKVVSKALFWATTVTTDTMTHAAPNPCGAPEGVLSGTTLSWSIPIANFHGDGTIFCNGSFCGKFGAPPQGRSALAIPPHSTLLKPLQFSGDMKTFTMASTFVLKTETPKQTSHLALAGREIRRACVSLACPRSAPP